MTARRMEMQPLPRPAGAARPALRAVQRKPASGAAPAAPAFAPSFAPAPFSGGAPLAASVRGPLESAFGRDLSHVRVHDDARAHDAARGIGARAFAAGHDVSFARGAYRPDTAAGRGLIAHEAAHVLQQAQGVHASGGPPPASALSRALEAEADAAAAAFAAGRPVPALAPAPRGALQRAPEDAAPPPAAPAAPTPDRLPAGMTALEDEPRGVGTTRLVLEIANFQMPRDKGAGPWVKEIHDKAAGGGRLVFTPIINGASVAAWKEGKENYKKLWLQSYGFTHERQIPTAFEEAAKTDPKVEAVRADASAAAILAGLGSSLSDSHCNIDHVVEKQMGGVSIIENLQLLEAKTNQDSGRDAYDAMVRLVKAVRAPGMRGPDARNMQLRFKAVTLASTDAAAGAWKVEDMLRSGRVKGDARLRAAAKGKPVTLRAGGMSAATSLGDAGKLALDLRARRLIPAVRLKTIDRGAGPGQKIQHIEGVLDSAAVKRGGLGDQDAKVHLHAELAPAGAGAQGDAAAGEVRDVHLTPGRNEAVSFYYPYLSPGTLGQLSLDDAGTLSARGVIRSTVPLFGDIAVTFSAPRDGADTLSVVAPIAADKLKPRNHLFRFTAGEVSLALAPDFIPGGDLEFEVGPATNPVLRGKVKAGLERGLLAVTGDLEPARDLPGVAAARGELSFTAEEGWSGKLTATSSSYSGVTADASFGFRSVGKEIKPFAGGGLHMQIKGVDVDFLTAWEGQGIGYYAKATIPKPLPMVPSVQIEGSFSDTLLEMAGGGTVTWNGISSDIQVRYRQKKGEEGAFSGGALIRKDGDPLRARVKIAVDGSGARILEGRIRYRFTDDLDIEFGAKTERDGRVRVDGEVAHDDIPLLRRWPSDKGGEIDLFRGKRLSFPFPIPGVSPLVNGTIGVSAGLMVKYHAGPVVLKAPTVKASFYPFEEDISLAASATSALSVDAYVGLTGTFGASIGAEFAGGVAGAEGGLSVEPTLGVPGHAGARVTVDYADGAFGFAAVGEASGGMEASLAVNLEARVYIAKGLWSYNWTYPLGETATMKLGPQLKLNLGEIRYGKGGELKLPRPSDISVEPSLDPKTVISDILSLGKTEEV
ncbi:eCIS core domain-containing protein [Rhodovulum sp. DZ06]|uniref:eCIS core domain-containing protein n=1 Tax=Rhodovulum sp. DZ06 TaxID=3425126 RepID=UPI003D33C164